MKYKLSKIVTPWLVRVGLLLWMTKTCSKIICEVDSGHPILRIWRGHIQGHKETFSITTISKLSKLSKQKEKFMLVFMFKQLVQTNGIVWTFILLLQLLFNSLALFYFLNYCFILLLYSIVAIIVSFSCVILLLQLLFHSLALFYCWYYCFILLLYSIVAIIVLLFHSIVGFNSLAAD